MATERFDYSQVQELLYQALETAAGGIEVYTTAHGCAINPDLKREWQQSLDRTERERDVLVEVLEQLGMDPEQRTPGREVLHHLAESLVEAIAMAERGPDPRAAELVASECVSMVEMRRRMNRELATRVRAESEGEARRLLEHASQALASADHGGAEQALEWTRALWMESLGLQVDLPPRAHARRAEVQAAVTREGRLM